MKRLFTLVLLACAVLWPASIFAGSSPLPPPTNPLSYEADIEDNAGSPGQLIRIHLLCSGLRYNMEYEDRWSNRLCAHNFYYYDASEPHMLWQRRSYGSFKGKTPIVISDLHNAHVDQGGIRQDIMIYDLNGNALGVQTHTYGLMETFAWAGTPSDRWRRVGTAMVAGYPCDIYEYRYVTDMGVPPFFNVPTRCTFISRTYVEPRSKLVFWNDKTVRSLPNRPYYYYHDYHKVTRFRFLSQPIPIHRFQLPPGVTAHVPDEYASVKLPPGVKRVRWVQPKPKDDGMRVIGAGSRK